MTDAKTIPIRDEGDSSTTPKEGSVLPVPRNAWPPDNFIHLKTQVKAGDENLVRKLQIRTQMIANAAEPEAAHVEATIEIYDQRIAYAAVLVKRIEGDWLREQLDEAAALLGPNGEMPEMISDRVRVVEEFPQLVMTYVDDQMAERIKAPLVGTTPVTKPSGGASGRKTTPSSKS